MTVTATLATSRLPSTSWRRSSTAQQGFPRSGAIASKHYRRSRQELPWGHTDKCGIQQRPQPSGGTMLRIRAIVPALCALAIAACGGSSGGGYSTGPTGGNNGPTNNPPNNNPVTTSAV